MYYKVIKNNKVVDVLDQLIYLKYQPKHKIMVLCDENEAQAILSSDKNTVWHERSLYNIPISGHGYETVEVVPIDKFDYEQLKMLNLKTSEEIIDALILELISKEVI